MAKRSSLRASDADRERVAERLRDAAAEGRILAHELEERLATALRARTYGELDSVVGDLPGSTAIPRPRSRARELARRQPVAAAAIMVLMLVVLVTMAALLVVTALTFGAIWMLVVLVTVGHRGSRYGGRPPRGIGARHRF